eukprot:m.438279 g.438279  ORF g.438279 m.438279 type:complete len:551 (+) comp21443_c0_seq2:76-1728(+)
MSSPANLLILAIGLLGGHGAIAQQTPKITSAGGRVLNFTGREFVFTTDSGSTTHSSILETLEELRNNKQDRVTGSCVSSAINVINSDGTVGCLDDELIPSIMHQVTTNAESLPRVCLLSAWSAWSSNCSLCGGNQTRTRRVVREANNSVPCSEYVTEQVRMCPVCPPPPPPVEEPPYDPCNGNERFYNLNGGTDQVRVASYVAQSVVYHRHANNDGQGGRGFGFRYGAFTAGQVQVRPGVSIQGGIRNGDYVCGTRGGVEVTGIRGALEKDWTPSRLNGTKFTFPVARESPIALVVLALEPATVGLYYGLVEANALYLEAGEMYTFTNINRNGANIQVNSTGAILMSYVGQAGTPLGIPGNIGAVDYTSVAPAANEVYGIPSTGYITSYQTRPITQRVDFRCSGNQTAFRTMNIMQYKTTPLSTSFARGPSCRGVARNNGLVAGASIGDGGGTDLVMWLPRAALRTQFLISTQVRYIALACAGTGSAVLQRSYGSTARQTIPITGNSFIGKAYSTNGAFLSAGSYVNTTVPCTMVVDAARDGDEILVFGY